MSARQTKGQMQGGPGNLRGKAAKGKGQFSHHKPWPGGKPKPAGLMRNGAQGKGC